MGRSKSTVHRHLNNLTEQDYVVQENGKYYPGLRSLRLAANALDLYDVYPISRPVVNELVSKTGESAAVAVEEKGRAVYLYHNRSNESVKTDARAGIEMFLHCTGAGKAILAHLPEERIDAVIEEHGLPKMTPNTITDRDELLAELEEIRELGYAFDDEERIEGMRLSSTCPKSRRPAINSCWGVRTGEPPSVANRLDRLSDRPVRRPLLKRAKPAHRSPKSDRSRQERAGRPALPRACSSRVLRPR